MSRLSLGSPGIPAPPAPCLTRDSARRMSPVTGAWPSEPSQSFARVRAAVRRVRCGRLRAPRESRRAQEGAAGTRGSNLEPSVAAYKEKMKELSMLSLICSCFYPEPRHGGIYTYDGECAAGAPAARAREKPAPLASLARLSRCSDLTA